MKIPVQIIRMLLGLVADIAVYLTTGETRRRRKRYARKSHTASEKVEEQANSETE